MMQSSAPPVETEGKLVSGLGLLSGMRVLCFEHMMQGPLASLLLRGLGAEVIKIEPFTGSVERGFAGRGEWLNGRGVLDLTVNRGKRSLSINLKNSRAKEITDRLFTKADAITTNFRPGVMKRLGLGFEQIHPRFPHIVYGSASGYGEDGPYQDLPGQDLLVQALTGLMYLQGRRTDPPIPLGAAMVDVHSGTLLALAVASGLVHRLKTGIGAKVEVDLMASALHLQMEAVHYSLNSDDPMVRPDVGLADPFHHPPYGVYPTANGYLAISTTDIGTLCECLATVGPISIPLDPNSREAFLAREDTYNKIAALVKAKTSEEWMAIFRPRGVWAGPVLQPGKDIRNDPQVRHRGLVETVRGKVSVETMKIPVTTPGNPTPAFAESPTIGGDNEAILSEIGFTKVEILEFARDGVICPTEATGARV